MAITSNILLQLTKGTIGKQIVIKKYGDKTVLSKYPDMGNRKLSPKQKKTNALMTEANYYAGGIMNSPEQKKLASIRLNVPENKLFRALVKEFMLNKGNVTK